MENKLYHIATEGTPEVFHIGNYREEGVVGPKTYGQIVNRPGKGLELTMWCFEENPQAIYFQPNEPVHTDSCMEAFINCFPNLPEKGYISVEMNANGAAHCSFGTCRADRRYVIDMGFQHPTVDVVKGERDGKPCWTARCLIEKSLLEALYGIPCDFEKGHQMRGNFYKCAENVPEPHWGSWAPVSKLDFHMPEHFGVFEVL